MRAVYRGNTASAGEVLGGMNPWKQFCRQVESKAVRKHFGDLVPLLDTSAIFEFTDEQIEAATLFDGPVSDEHPVPPFPFSRLCLLGPGGVLMLTEPTMDEETGILRYNAIAGHRSGLFKSAVCEVDTRSRPIEVQVSGLRGVDENGRYFDEDHPISEDVETETRDTDAAIAQLRDLIDQVARRGETRKAERLRAKLSRVEELAVNLKRSAAELEEANRAVADASARWSDAVVTTMTEVFKVALRQVQWINKPDHYTVEVGVADPPRKPKPGRAKRLQDRARYIVLTKHEIAEAWRRANNGGTHASPIPHLRRGHYRTLTAERYKTKKRVWVRASHVNGKCVEWRHGDVRYKVV